MRLVRRSIALASLAALAASCTSSPTATPTTIATTTPATSSTTTTTTTTTTTPPTTTTAPAPVVITRPYVDPVKCGSGVKALATFDHITLHPFASGFETPIPLQVLAAPVDGVAKPFAVVLRMSANSRDRSTDHPVLVHGMKVSVVVMSNGNGSAAWTLPDGTKAYLRARGFDQAAIVRLVARLTPRASTAAIPGFDLTPPSGDDHLMLLAEHLNTGLSGGGTMYRCEPVKNKGAYRINAIYGDPTLVYFSILDRPRPYAVGVDGTGALTIENYTKDRVLELSDIVNAPAATWAQVPTVRPEL
jgi:hypothetical protein